ncbi:MAG: hypothetical protein EPN77_10035 [Candidimonas sp.]|nr:MAG: hypothetical protein EPN77_10035 [Candidimonas sp.]
MKKSAPSSEGKPFQIDHRLSVAHSQADSMAKSGSELDNHKNRKTPSQTKEDALDNALEETFPASDPVSIAPAVPPRLGS